MWASMSLLKLNGDVLAVHVNTNKTFLDVSEFALISSKGYLDLYNFVKGNHIELSTQLSCSNGSVTNLM